MTYSRKKIIPIRRMLRCLFLFFFSCSPAYSSTLKIGASRDINDFFPIYQKMGESHYLRNFVAPPVVAIDQNQKWICIVCTSIPTMENEKAQIIENDEGNILETHWTIDHKYYWNDGTKVTARDVKYSIERITGKSSLAQRFSIELSQKDPLSFKIIFNSIRADYFQILAFSLLPHHKSKLVDKIEAEGKLDNRSFEKLGLYYGPYQVASMTKNHLRLTDNPHFKGLKNKFDRIEFSYLKSLEDAKKLIKSSRIHMIADGTFSNDDMISLMADKKIRDTWQMQYSQSSWLDILQINLRNPYLADVGLRKAIFLTLDRSNIMADLYQNFGSISPMPPFFNRNDRAKTDAHNLAQARRLLNASGWDLHEGVRRKNGVSLEFELAYHATSKKQKLAEKIRDQLGQVQIRLKLLPYKNLQYFLKKILARGFYRDLSLTTYLIYPKMNLSPYFHSESIPSEENDYDGYNFAYWQNYKINALLKNLQGELDPEKREQYQKDFESIFVEQLPAIPLFYEPRLSIFSRNLVNIRFPGHNYHTSLYSSGWMTQKKPKDVFY